MPSSIATTVWEQLVTEATQARSLAYAPYSNFQVGAALLTSAGTVVVGCNIENATFGATCCAERTAVFSAIAQGHRKFAAMAVVTGSEAPSTSCGICRQVLAEFAYDMPILFRSTDGAEVLFSVRDLLPEVFVLKS